MLGTGEYTTGYVDGKGADSDKSAGVVALCMLDLQLRGKVGRLGMCGTNAGSQLKLVNTSLLRLMPQACAARLDPRPRTSGAGRACASTSRPVRAASAPTVICPRALRAAGAQGG